MMPKRSPSCISVSAICLKTCRTLGVELVTRCRSSTNSTKIRPAVTLVGRDDGKTMPSCTGAGSDSCVKTRPPCTSTSDTISCSTPSSSTRKSSFVKSGMKRPSRFRTMTSVVTRVTPARNVGCCAPASICPTVDGAGSGGACASTRAGRPRRPQAQRPRLRCGVLNGCFSFVAL